MNEIRVLAVGPHPDDAEFGAGGWLAKLDAAGAGTYIATFPPADAGHGEIRGEVRGDVAGQRMTEAAEGAAVLGAQFRALPAARDEPEIARVVHALITEVAPDIVVTVDPEDSHPWHRIVSLGVTTSVFTAQAPTGRSAVAAPAQLLYMCAYTSVDFRPDVLIDVTAHYGRAVKALRCHTTGLAVTPMLDYQMRLTHQLSGCRASVELAEGFRLSHQFGQDWCSRRAVLYPLLGA